jgi:hypothetical protein
MFPLAHELAGLAAQRYATATEEAIANFPWTNTGDEPHD